MSVSAPLVREERGAMVDQILPRRASKSIRYDCGRPSRDTVALKLRCDVLSRSRWGGPQTRGNSKEGNDGRRRRRVGMVLDEDEDEDEDGNGGSGNEGERGGRERERERS